MATSGTSDYTLIAGDLIEQAFGKIGVKEAEQPLQASEMQDGLNVLNAFLKALNTTGGHLWTQEEGVLFLDKGKASYNVGPTGDKAALLDDFIGTRITSDLSTVAIMPVISSSGMIAGDNVGVQMDDGTRFWTTILTVDSAVQITLTDALPSSSASNSTVFTYTNPIERPLRVPSFRRKTFGVDSEIKVNSWARSQYFNQTNKEGQGTVVNAYYSPLLGNGRLYVWQTASSVNDMVRFSFERSIQDVGDKENNLDLPAEWMETVIYNIAARLLDDYKVPQDVSAKITGLAKNMLDNALGWDEEVQSINMQPDFD